MTSPITYPPSISLYGAQLALQNELATITYTGVDGSIFYLAGPYAPVAGAQDGLVLLKHMGLMSPFKMLELQGARQDGGTWTDTVYEPGEIMLSLEASGIAPQNIRNVLRQWISAWDPAVGNPGHPTQLGRLTVYTPDMGEWYINARMSKNVSDQFTKDFTYSGRQPLTWACKNYDAFWFGAADSVSVFNANDAVTIVTTATPSGSYTLTIPGFGTTVPIGAFAIPTDLQTAIGDVVGTANVIVDNVRRTLSGVSYDIQFVEDLAAQAIGTITADLTSFVGNLGIIQAVTQWL